MKKEKEKFNKGEIVIYQTSKKEVSLKVQLENETVWLSQKQMAALFNKDVRTINEHIKNIFKDGELAESSVIRKFRITADDGKKYQTNFYNLDAILSVGYRVSSQKATQFRIWATSVLKKYLLQGYAINEQRLMEAKNKFSELQKTISLLQKHSKKELLKGQEKEILNLLADYSKTLSLLEQYDEKKLKSRKGQKSKFTLKYDICLTVIKEIKRELIFKKEASSLFGQERSGVFEGIIKGLYQTFAKKELYNSIEDKAAHLLYLIIKDHPFSDGNKRIASFLFVYFLDKSNFLYSENGEKKINDNALTAVSLLVAQSDSKEKEQIIALITQLLK